MFVKGKNASREILNSNYVIKNIYLLENFNNEELIKLINKKNIKVTYKSINQMNKMVKENHQGIILEVEDYKYLDFNEIRNDKNADFIVILDHIEDPRNFGAIVRTASCARVNYIVVPSKREALVTEGSLKTSSGALATSKIVMVANLRNTIEKLKELGYWIVGADMDGEDYKKINYEGKVALVIGNEGTGLKPLIRKSCDVIASIPLYGSVDSLNASVAAGILMYEVIRNK